MWRLPVVCIAVVCIWPRSPSCRQWGCGRSGGCSYPSELEGNQVGRKGQWRKIMFRKSTSGRSVGIYSFWYISWMKNSSLLCRCCEYVQNYIVACSQSETLEGYPHHWHRPRLGIREFRTSQVCRCWRAGNQCSHAKWALEKNLKHQFNAVATTGWHRGLTPASN